MNTTIIATLMTVSGSIMVAALTFYLTKRHEIKVEWQKKAQPARPESSRGVKTGLNGAGLGFAQAISTIKDTTALEPCG